MILKLPGSEASGTRTNEHGMSVGHRYGWHVSRNALRCHVKPLKQSTGRDVDGAVTAFTHETRSNASREALYWMADMKGAVVCSDRSVPHDKCTVSPISMVQSPDQGHA